MKRANRRCDGKGLGDVISIVYKPLKNSSLQWCGLKSNWLITQIMSTCRNDRISLLTIFINVSSFLDILSSSNSQSLCYTIQSFFVLSRYFFWLVHRENPALFSQRLAQFFCAAQRVMPNLFKNFIHQLCQKMH